MPCDLASGSTLGLFWCGGGGSGSGGGALLHGWAGGVTLYAPWLHFLPTYRSLLPPPILTCLPPPCDTTELWINATTPFTGTCGGSTVAKSVLYVTDDTDQLGYLYAFKKADVDAELRKGQAGGKVFVMNNNDGEPAIWGLEVTASHVYFDNDLVNPR
jgi:hypothetical protein